jgi:hypothetical protein
MSGAKITKYGTITFKGEHDIEFEGFSADLNHEYESSVIGLLTLIRDRLDREIEKASSCDVAIESFNCKGI